jgi:hypothetical protein
MGRLERKMEGQAGSREGWRARQAREKDRWTGRLGRKQGFLGFRVQGLGTGKLGRKQLVDQRHG